MITRRNHGGVLLVEDDDALRHLLAMALGRAGFRVRTACDEKTALEAFREQPPAAVVTDLILPAGEGMSAIRAMREAVPDAPIIVISGGGFFSSSQLCSVAKSFGANAALTKPFRAEALVACLSELIAPPLAELAA